MSNTATVQTPTRLEIMRIECALPKTRQVIEVMVNGRPQPKLGRPVKRGDYLQWAAGAGTLALSTVRPLPDEVRLEVIVR